MRQDIYRAVHLIMSQSIHGQFTYTSRGYAVTLVAVDGIISIQRLERLPCP